MVNFTQDIIKDILSSEEYSITGLANHTHIPEEVLSDVASGINTNPTFELSRKLLEIHMTVRRNLYDQIMNKILYEYFIKKSNLDKLVSSENPEQTGLDSIKN